MPAHVASRTSKPKGHTMQTYDPHKSPTEARQGSDRRMNLRVLAISFIGILVLFAIVFAVFTANPGA